VLKVGERTILQFPNIFFIPLPVLYFNNMNTTKEVRIENEVVYMKKSFDGWRIVYPIKNSDGSWNYKNLILGGSWWNFIKVFAIFLLLILAIVIYHYDTKKCSETLTHIDKICEALAKGEVNPQYNSNKLNFTIPNG